MANRRYSYAAKGCSSSSMPCVQPASSPPERGPRAAALQSPPLVPCSSFPKSKHDNFHCSLDPVVWTECTNIIITHAMQKAVSDPLLCLHPTISKTPTMRPDEMTADKNIPGKASSQERGGRAMLAADWGIFSLSLSPSEPCTPLAVIQGASVVCHACSNERMSALCFYPAPGLA